MVGEGLAEKTLQDLHFIAVMLKGLLGVGCLKAVFWNWKYTPCVSWIGS